MDERMVELMQGVNGLPGGGPWRILKDCGADVHNSTRAGLGRGHGFVTRLPCTCPRALEMLAQYQARRLELREIERVSKRRPRQDKRARLQLPLPLPAEIRSPNFIEGLCTKPGNMAYADKGMNDQASLAGIADRQEAKDLCAVCPMKLECKAWALGQEKPAGSWGGVWGGMDPWNRKGLELVIQDGRAEVIPYVTA